MKHGIIACIIIFIATACTPLLLGEDPKNTAVATFDEFWEGIDQIWPEFETKQVNWDSMYQTYRPKISLATSESDLRSVMSSMVDVLKDQHTNVYPGVVQAIAYRPAYPANFYGLDWIKVNYLQSVKGNRAIAYGLLNADVGYVNIVSFSNASDQYSIIDNILTEFRNVKGIIIDVRNNSGGNSSNGETIASRFADKERLYGFTRSRINSSTKSMGDFIPTNISPSGQVQFNGKVAVLTNRVSFSATEDFVLMMKAFGQVKQIGDNTGGGSGSRPIFKELPNGWTYRVSSRLVCDLSRKPITGGIVPDIRVSTSRADSLKRKDSIIEAAMAEVIK